MNDCAPSFSESIEVWTIMRKRQTAEPRTASDVIRRYSRTLEAEAAWVEELAREVRATSADHTRRAHRSMREAMQDTDVELRGLVAEIAALTRGALRARSAERTQHRRRRIWK
ncbi:hypothetical protein KO481_33325 [Nocardia sp. NEAU-G5]|uniref:Transposase n=1 Tax=Nocardia albiluteola TaxID=2842303 RepID=A0ABS6B9E7_9NOCA|nr:hypothetical protein [Nocardia albiluteola]MBU3066390.1 hypothetical protein [Nocardia albiluteola]